jgi:hypothetical protein
MNNPKSQASKSGRRPAGASTTYRGLRVQATGGQTRFSIDQIRRAVEVAIEKNADALAGRT